MSVTRRGKVYHLRFRPFGRELITVSTSAQTKSEAVRIERSILTACRANDFRALDPEARGVCLQMFRNRGLELPSDLSCNEPIKEELTLWRAIEIFLNYPGVKESKARGRYVYSLQNVVRKWGKQKPLKNVWVPDLRLYQSERLSEGAAAATINWELATVSKLYGILIELQILETNPVRMIKRLSTKAGERQVYLSFGDVHEIARRCPPWAEAVIMVAYFSGMRRGEILNLTWRNVNLPQRIIHLGAADTKEGAPKRVPLRQELVPLFEDAMRVRSLGTDKVFLIDGRPPNEESVKNPWRKAVKAMGLDPRPRFHDLRHTWKTNARRSRVDPEIRESILGHWFKEKSVSERYGFISDREYVEAVDAMTFDHGDTQIWTNQRARDRVEKCAQNVRKRDVPRKKAVGEHDLTI